MPRMAWVWLWALPAMPPTAAFHAPPEGSIRGRGAAGKPFPASPGGPCAGEARGQLLGLLAG